MATEQSHSQIERAGHVLTLMPSGAMYCDQLQTLWVADVHIGKAATYRQLGQPVPQGTTTQTLKQLSHDLHQCKARHLIVLGDFLHGPQVHRSPPTLEALKRWRVDHQGCVMTLIRGNHDDRAGDPPAELAIEVVDEPSLLVPGLACCHDRRGLDIADNLTALWGHVHPVALLRGKARDQLRLPCFVVGRDHVLLPAYGAFTGGHPYEPSDDETLYVIAGESVFKLPASKSAARQG